MNLITITICPTSYEVVYPDGGHPHYSERITIERRSDDMWAVCKPGLVLSDDWFEYEPMPSNRDDDFISRTRFTFTEALRRVEELLTDV